MKIIFIFLIAVQMTAFSQPILYRKDKFLDDETFNMDAAKLSKANVKTRSIYMAAEFGKEKKYLYELNKYDNAGRIVETRDYLPSGLDAYTYMYIYDNAGLITRKTEVYIIDSVTSTHETFFTYDSKGRLLNRNETRTNGKNFSTQYLYDDIKNTITSNSFEVDSLLSSALVYYFNENNWIIKAESIDKEGKNRTSEINYYKDSIQIIDKENGAVSKIEGISFDASNNVTERRFSIPGQESYIQYKAEYQNGIIVSEKMNHRPEGYYLLEKTYDKMGNPIIENYYEAKGKISQKRILRYNDKNLLIGIAEGDENIDYDKSPDKTIYEYEYYK